METPPKKRTTIAHEQATNRLLNAIISKVTKSRASHVARSKKATKDLKQMGEYAQQLAEELDATRAQVKDQRREMEGMVYVNEVERAAQIIRTAADVRREMIPHLQNGARRGDQSAAAVTYENCADLLDGLIIAPVRKRQGSNVVSAASCPHTIKAMEAYPQGKAPECDGQPQRVAIDGLTQAERELISSAMDLVRSGEQPSFAAAFKAATRPRPIRIPRGVNPFQALIGGKDGKKPISEVMK